MTVETSAALSAAHPFQGAGAPPVQSPLGVVGVVAALYTLLFGATVWFALRAAQTGTGTIDAALDIAICLAPALLAGVLARTSQADRQQYVARLMACAVMLPLLLLMWATSQPVVVSGALVWSAAGVLFVAHIALFVGAVFWLARRATGIEAQPGAAVVGATLLGQRLQSLADAQVPADVTPGQGAGEWLVELRFGPGVPRSHRVRLLIDEPARRVRVRERLAARGAAPQDADEASLRSIGDTWFDPSRPQAQRVSGITLQASMIEPSRLAATCLALDGGRVTLLAPAAADLDADGVVSVLAALVTRSGYGWQPELGAA